MVGLSVLALGSATPTLGTAWLSVHSFSLEPDSSRARIPVATISPAPISATTPKMPNFRRETGGRGSVGMRLLRWSVDDDALFLVYHTKYHGNKHQGGDGRKDQPPDHGPSQRRVLLAALAEPKRHRRHADDHGERRHQHRTESDETGFQRGGDGIAEFLITLARKTDH